MRFTASRALGLHLPVQKRWLSECSSPAICTTRQRSWDPDWTAEATRQAYDPFLSKEYPNALNIIHQEIEHAALAPARML